MSGKRGFRGGDREYHGTPPVFYSTADRESGSYAIVKMSPLCVVRGKDFAAISHTNDRAWQCHGLGCGVRKSTCETALIIRGYLQPIVTVTGYPQLPGFTVALEFMTFASPAREHG